ncbi:hypothetical protein [Priestia taiwanensis]|uniref:Uncharacterized protein n=1 Tax=Priestia taiwanensis TaxID=1347902 RepID=A0A917AUU6_9BACI|nr:hypothetical protein [Priestia taiwanensis]MBM7363585.1 hypothetical protein [Priestia taiwanensis]GGE75878.1 hypothetical protein GCM10007140_27040 [Priestia taiwanensis]
MKQRKLLPYSRSPWLQRFFSSFRTYVVPLTVFQGFRTLFFPSFVDITLFFILLAFAISFRSNKF